MIKAILLIAYLSMGDRGPVLKEEKQIYDTMELCNKKAAARVAEISAHPRFLEGIIAACVPSVVTEV